MTKIDKLIEKIVAAASVQNVDCDDLATIRKLANALVQATRDEEFKKHEQRINCGSVGSARLSYCASCPIIGTRYCP